MSTNPPTEYNPEWAKHGYTKEDHMMDLHGVTRADLYGTCECGATETKTEYESGENCYVKKCVKCGAWRGKAD